MVLVERHCIAMRALEGLMTTPTRVVEIPDAKIGYKLTGCNPARYSSFCVRIALSWKM
jgi:hypothetical protein